MTSLLLLIFKLQLTISNAANATAGKAKKILSFYVFSSVQTHTQCIRLSGLEERFGS